MEVARKLQCAITTHREGSFDVAIVNAAMAYELGWRCANVDAWPMVLTTQQHH